MGIKGLLPLLSSIQQDVNISEYKGKTVAVDTYCWLHKAVYTCSYELCLGRPTKKYINYVVRRVKSLRSAGVEPIMVFDGGKLDMKAGEEDQRRENREVNKRRGICFLGKGNTKEAVKHFQRAVDITPQMAYNVIKELKKLNVKCIVAPYEADSQLAYLSITGRVECVISEDSDLLVFGCKRVLFKMEPNGNGKEIRLNELCHVTSVDFANWSQKMFVEMCIMSGCDYLSSIPRVGLKKAHSLINHYRSTEKAVDHLRFEGKMDVPKDYEISAEKAFLTFKHQTIYDDTKKILVSLTEIPNYVNLSDRSFLGEFFDKELVVEICEGLKDPISHELFKLEENHEKVTQRTDFKKLKNNKLTDYFKKAPESNKKKKVIAKQKRKKAMKVPNGSKTKKSKNITNELNEIDQKNKINENEFSDDILADETNENDSLAVTSPFLSARRLSVRRNYGGFDFSKNKKLDL